MAERDGESVMPGDRASSADIRKVYEDAIKRKTLRAKDVVRSWLIGPSCQACPICLGFAQGANNLMFRPYRNGTASIMQPPAHEGCDCIERYTINLTDYKRSPF